MRSSRRAGPLSVLGLVVLPVLVLTLLLLPSTSLQQQGRILYVNHTDPTCHGQSPCYQTIQAAVNAAQAGDTIRIQAGTYQEQVSISGKNNTATAAEADRIVIEADPSTPVGSVTLTGAVSQCTNGYAILLQQSKFITIRGLTITGAGGQAISLMGGNNQSQAIHIERNRIFGNGSSECNGGITIARGNPGTLIVNNLIYGNGRNGITFIDADGGPHYLIENTIFANAWSGVNVARSHEVYLVNNLITGNGTASGSTGGRYGVSREDSTSPNPSGIRLLYNLLCANRLGEINGPALDATDAGNLTPTGSEGSGVLASSGCEVSSNVYASLNGPDGLPNTADDDVGLAPTSPAIDWGMDPRSMGLDPAFNPLLEADYATAAIRPRDGNGDGTAFFDLGARELLPPNRAPVANADQDQTVNAGTLVALNGSNSFDPDGDPIAFQWTQLTGPTVSLATPTAAITTFTAPQVSTQTALTFELQVSDGHLTSTATVTITVLPGGPPANRPPVLTPIGSQTVTVGSTLTFTVTASDPDGDPLTYAVSPLPLPANASFPAATHVFTFAPAATQVGIYSLTFSVNDGRGGTASETITITVTGIPAVASVTPASGTQGATFTATVRGSNTHFAAGSTELSFGPNVSVAGAPENGFGPAAVTDPLTAAAAIAINPTAALGPRTVAARTGAEEISQADALAVLPPAPPARSGTSVSTLAGTGSPGFADGPGAQAQFAGPEGLGFTSDGSLVLADSANHRIRRIAPDGSVTTLAGNGTPGLLDGGPAVAEFNSPQGISPAPDGSLYVADTDNHVLRRVAPDGTVSTLAGTGIAGYQDGPGPSAQFHAPRGLALRSDGMLLIGDEGNARLRLFNPADGTVSTLAGSGTTGFLDGLALQAQFGSLAGLAADANGDVYIADTANQRIRKLDAAGNVSTLAGDGTFGFRDGPAALARFADPTGLALDAAGTLYVADAFNSLIRQITPQGTVGTLAGTGARGFTDGPGVSATFRTPHALALDGQGRVAVTDTGNHAVRLVGVAPTITGLAPPSVVHGQTVALVIAGSDLGGATAVTFLTDATVDSNITASDLQANAEGTELQATIAITPVAALGSRLVTVTTPGGTSDATAGGNTFTVLGQLSLVPNFVSLTEGQSGALTIHLSAPAPAGGLTVALQSAAPGIASIPASVTVSAGATSAPTSVTAVSRGTTNITASAPGFAPGQSTITVTPPVLAYITVTPQDPTRRVGETLQLQATGTLTDGSTLNITSGVTWMSSSPTVATVASTGLATALASGTTTLTAAYLGGFTAGTTLTVLPPPPGLSKLEPPSLTIPRGGTGTLMATLSAVQPADTMITLLSSDPTIASVPPSATVPSGQLAVAVPVVAGGPGTATITATLNATSLQSTVTVPAGPTLTSLLPATLFVSQGVSGPLTISLSAVQPTDTVITLASSDPTIMTVPSEGAVTIPAGQRTRTFSVAGLQMGRAMLTASLNGSTVASAIAVTNATPTVVSLEPPVLPLAVGSGGTLTVTLNATQPTDTEVFLATSDEWSIGLPGDRVTVPANTSSVAFTVTGITPWATPTVTASLNEQTATAAVWIQLSVPAVQTVTCPAAVAVGATGQCKLTLNATQATDTEVPLTGTAPSVLAVPASVTILANTLTGAFEVTGVASGSADVVGGPLTGTTQQATVQVVPPSPTLVSLLPNPASLAVGAMTTLTVALNAVQPTDTTIPLAANVPGVVSLPLSVVVPAGSLAAAVPAISLTSGTVTLSLGPLNGTQAQSTLTVDQLPPTVTAVMPAEPVVVEWMAVPLSAAISAAQAQPTVLRLTSSDPDTVWVPPSVTVPAGARSAAFPIVAGVQGSATLTVGPLNESSVQVMVTVNALEIGSFAIVPATATIAKDQTQRFMAVTTYTDGTLVDETLWDRWQSSNTAVATIVSKGVAKGVAPGTTTITARSEGAGTATATLTVALPPGASLVIAPRAPTALVGGQVQLQATATYADGSSQDLTAAVTWTSSDPAVATITSPGGLATGLAPGATTITARLGDASATATLTVIPASPTSLTLTPAAPTRAVGESVQFQATGTYTDGTTRDLSAAVTWTSSNPAVATITSPGGLATALTPGTTIITATYPGTPMASTTLTVVVLPPTIDSMIPSKGRVGTLVALLGANLRTTTQVLFNGTAAAFTVQSATQVNATVPPGATSGPVTITTLSGTGTSATSFILTAPPTITITTPADGANLTGASVQVNGTVTSDVAEVSVSVNAIAAQVNGGQWSVTVPLQAGINTLTAVAVDATGAQATASVTVTVSGPAPATILLAAIPDSGPAPLTVRWQVTNLTGRPLLRYELDAYGTGSFAPPLTTLDGVQTTYTTPGLVHPLLRATDDQGTQYIATTTVNVLPLNQTDALLREKWNGLRAALSTKAIDVALGFFTPPQQSRYRELFTALSDQLPEIAQDMQDLQLVFLGDQQAKYRLRRTELYGGQVVTFTYYVYFVQDATGFWSVEEF